MNPLSILSAMTATAAGMQGVPIAIDCIMARNYSAAVPVVLSSAACFFTAWMALSTSYRLEQKRQRFALEQAEWHAAIRAGEMIEERVRAAIIEKEAQP